MSLGFIIAQVSVFEAEPGYIVVKADTTTVPVYIDGTLIGHTPLDHPIPVMEGLHHITHHPPSIQDPFLQYAKTDAVKQVFVLSGDTVNVRLDTLLLADQLAQAKKEYYFTNYVGIGLVILLLWQMWILAN